MRNLFYFLSFLLCYSCGAQDIGRKRIFEFENSRIFTDTCKDGALMRIEINENLVYDNCFPDAFFISEVDTFNLNDDSLAEIVFNLEMGDYSVLYILVFNKRSMVFDLFDLADISSAELYSGRVLKKNEKFKEFIIADVGGNNTPEILTNVILNDKKIIRIENFTKVLSRNQILEMIKK